MSKMSQLKKRSTRSIALATVAVVFFLPAVSAAAAGTWVDGGLGYHATGTAPINVTREWYWSRFEHETKRHGSSAYGDIDGLVRSACQAPGVRAYAQSRYSIFGGSRNAYYRYPC
jgi:hypothetical protein